MHKLQIWMLNDGKIVSAFILITDWLKMEQLCSCKQLYCPPESVLSSSLADRAAQMAIWIIGLLNLTAWPASKFSLTMATFSMTNYRFSIKLCLTNWGKYQTYISHIYNGSCLGKMLPFETIHFWKTTDRELEHSLKIM